MKFGRFFDQNILTNKKSIILLLLQKSESSGKDIKYNGRNIFI